MYIRFPAFLCVVWLLSCAVPLCAQDSLLNKWVTVSCVNCSRSQALQRLSEVSGLNIVFSDRLFQRCGPVTFPNKPERVRDLLSRVSSCSYVNYRYVDQQAVFSAATPTFTLRGHVVDAVSGERLIGAGLRFSLGRTHVGAISNEQGFFSVSLPAGQYTLTINYVGYTSRTMDLTVSENSYVTLRMSTEMELPETVVVPLPELPGEIHSTGAAKRWMNLESAQRLPAPGGETDLLRFAALQTGVQTGVDGLGGLHIRGGNADQNLILLDDVPIYNPSHALGMWSVFNLATVKSAQCWKGDQPARFGGRLSSVLDLRTRDGNTNNAQAEGSIGLLASSVTVETPLVRDKSALLIGARSTHLSPWIHLFKDKEKFVSFSGDQLSYRYLDFTGKYHYTFSEKDRLYITYYQGSDALKNTYQRSLVANQQHLDVYNYNIDSEWGNAITAARWTREINPRLIAHTTLHHSRFFYSSNLLLKASAIVKGREQQKENYAQLYRTRIRDISAKTDLSYYYRNNLKLRSGVVLTRHNFQPGTMSVDFLNPDQSRVTIDSLTNRLRNNEQLTAYDLESYAEMDWLLDKRWRIEAGLRGNVFITKNINYPNVQPRFHMQYNGASGWAHWASFAQHVQNLHQIGSFNISLPFELWVPSTDQVKPEKAWQVSTGLGWSNKAWNVQAEGYYKKFTRIHSFLSNDYLLATSGAEAANGWEDRIVSGQGDSRGLEISLEKTKGKLYGTLAYTFSNSMRRFPDLNKGRVFPFRFDRLHDIKLTVRYRFNRLLEANAIWTFATGNPITLTGVRYVQTSTDGSLSQEIFAYPEMNGYRLPNTHRLDLSINLGIERRHWSHHLMVGTYNTYNRQNPFFMYLISTGNDKVKAIQYTLLPLLPILRYEIRWSGNDD